MNLLVYIIVYPFMWLISRMSFGLIYLFSDIVYYLIYYIFSYRKKVVRENLKLAFPKMSIEERIKIEKKYYKYLSDIFLESLKTMNISEDEMKVYTRNKKFDVNGWIQTLDFYVVNEKGMKSNTFLKLCQIGNNY